MSEPHSTFALVIAATSERLARLEAALGITEPTPSEAELYRLIDEEGGE